MQRLRWHLNHRIRWLLPALNLAGARLTVIDHFGSPGDTLLTAQIAHRIKERHPRIRVRVLTRNPDLLAGDPSIDACVSVEDYWSVRFAYYDLVAQKHPTRHILEPTLQHLGMKLGEPTARYFVSDAERARAREILGRDTRPLITLNVGSREKVKMWPSDRWQRVVDVLSTSFRVVQLGDATEPRLEGTEFLAGRLPIRDSVAVLAEARLHLGSVSFLMHAANGVGVPSVIVYGGREKPANSAYPSNANLASSPECSPCWIHDSLGQTCGHNLKCMDAILPEQVLQAARKLLGLPDAKP